MLCVRLNLKLFRLAAVLQHATRVWVVVHVELECE